MMYMKGSAPEVRMLYKMLLFKADSFEVGAHGSEFIRAFRVEKDLAPSSKLARQTRRRELGYGWTPVEKRCYIHILRLQEDGHVQRIAEDNRQRAKAIQDYVEGLSDLINERGAETTMLKWHAHNRRRAKDVTSLKQWQACLKVWRLILEAECRSRNPESLHIPSEVAYEVAAGGANWVAGLNMVSIIAQCLSPELAVWFPSPQKAMESVSRAFRRAVCHTVRHAVRCGAARLAAL